MKHLLIAITILALLTVTGYPTLARNNNVELETWNVEHLSGDNVWAWCSQGMWGAKVRALALSPGYATDHTLFVGTDGSSVWQYTFVTQTPTPTATATPTPAVRQVYLRPIMKRYITWVPDTPTPTLTATPSRTPTPTSTATRTPTPWCDPYEPNDSPAQAKGPLDSGKSYQARLCVGDPDDWYYFTIQATSTITIDLTVPSTVDYDLYLYYNPYTSPVAISNNGQGVKEHIDYTPQSIGKYYVRVYPFSGRDDVNPYTLQVTFR